MKSEKYKLYIRSLPCLVSGYDGEEIIYHHVRFAGHCGQGQKPSDLFCVPLRQLPYHIEVHQMSDKPFWEKHNIDIKMEIIKLLMGFIKNSLR